MADTPTTGGSGEKLNFERRIISLKRRLVREATTAISMLETALDALWRLDVEAARAVRREDDHVDREEVAIEQESYEILALQHVFARDFRAITFTLKVNADIERVADHATSIAKLVGRISNHAGGHVPRWPTALTELGQRVPLMCHELMRAVLEESPEAAVRVVDSDEVIDQLERRLFEEIIEHVGVEGGTDSAIAIGLLMSRLGRELERIGDLMTNVAEDLVYLATGVIVRHEAKKSRRRRREAPPAGSA